MPPTPRETFRPESAGIIALVGKWFSFAGARRDLADATKQTDGLTKDLNKVRDSLIQQIRALSNQNLEATSNDTAALAQSRLRFQQAAAGFKQLSTLIVPLGEQGVTLETAHNLLDEWHDSLWPALEPWHATCCCDSAFCWAPWRSC